MRKSISYRNQPVGMLCKSMDWFLHDRDLHHERVKEKSENLNSEDLASNLAMRLWVAFGKNYHHIKQGKVFALVIETDT